MKIKKYFAGLIILGLVVVATFAFLIVKATGTKVVYPVEVAERRTIEAKVLASGSIIPQKEVEVKSSLSGVVNEIFAVAGDPIKKGDPILSIRVVPNSLDLNSSESALEKASIRLKNAEAELERNKSLFNGKIIAEVEYKKSVTAYDLALEDYKEAKNRIMLIKEGISSGKEAINNVILSPITGTVLDILVKQGAPVQESGGYSVGTTVAAIADMSSLIFEGEIDEAQIDSLKKGMEANIKLAAIDNKTIPGTLDFLSPRGINSSGSVKFKLRIVFSPEADLFLRAGYSASAEIILSRAENSLCVKERDLLMEGGKYYAELEKGRQKFVKTEVTVGISDGLYTEITGGLSEGDRIKSQRESAAL
jgi:HlyD family secretion protein